MPSLQSGGPDRLQHAPWECYVYVGGNSLKFWRVRSAGCHTETWWGRNGTAGQAKVKSFGTAGAAFAARLSLVASKLAKGYRLEENPNQSSPPGTWAKMSGAEKAQALQEKAEASKAMAAKANGSSPGGGPALVPNWFQMTESQRTEFVRQNGSEAAKRLISESRARLDSGRPAAIPLRSRVGERKPPALPPPATALALGRFSTLTHDDEEEGT